MFLCQEMLPPFWLHLWEVDTHELEKQISKSVATTHPLPTPQNKKRSQMDLSSSLSCFLVDLKLSSLPCENASKETGHQLLPTPGIHTGTRRQRQRIFSQTPGKPAVRMCSSSPENHRAEANNSQSQTDFNFQG